MRLPYISVPYIFSPHFSVFNLSLDAFNCELKIHVPKRRMRGSAVTAWIYVEAEMKSEHVMLLGEEVAASFVDNYYNEAALHLLALINSGLRESTLKWRVTGIKAGALSQRRGGLMVPGFILLLSLQTGNCDPECVFEDLYEAFVKVLPYKSPF